MFVENHIFFNKHSIQTQESKCTNTPLTSLIEKGYNHMVTPNYKLFRIHRSHSSSTVTISMVTYNRAKTFPRSNLNTEQFVDRASGECGISVLVKYLDDSSRTIDTGDLQWAGVQGEPHIDYLSIATVRTQCTSTRKLF